MKESKLFKILLAGIVIVALGVPAYATAADKSDLKGVSVKVSYGDLDLEKYEGAKALYRRLQQASRQACGLQIYSRERKLKSTTERLDCYGNTLSEAVAAGPAALHDA